MAGADFWYMTTAIHLLVLLPVLVVIVRLERQLRAANRALETTTVEEGEVLQGPDPVHLIDRVGATQAGGFVEIRTVHCFVRVLDHFTTFGAVFLFFLEVDRGGRSNAADATSSARVYHNYALHFSGVVNTWWFTSFLFLIVSIRGMCAHTSGHVVHAFH